MSVNHFFHLLASTGPGDAESGPGWEPGDPGWVTPEAPGLSGVAVVLFGRHPDVWMRRYRAHQLCGLVYADPSLRALADGLDPRHSLDDGPSAPFDAAWDAAEITPATSPSLLRVAGPHHRPDQAGRLSVTLHVHRAAAAWSYHDAREPQQVRPLEAANQQVPLPTGHRLIYSEGLPVGEYTVHLRMRPADGWADLERRLRALPAADLVALFRGLPELRAGFGDPVDAFRRLGAAAAALALQREAARA